MTVLTLMDGFLFGAGAVLLVGGLLVRGRALGSVQVSRARFTRDHSTVVDGFTRPSVTVAALCAQPLPSERGGE